MAPKSDPQKGVSVDVGDRLVGAGCKDSSGNYEVPNLDADGNIKVNVATGSVTVGTIEITNDVGNPIPVSGTLTAVTTVTSLTAIANALPSGTNNIGDVDVASIAAGDNNIGNVDVVTLPSIPAGTNNIGDVDVLSSALPTGASTLAEQQSQTTSLSTIAGDTTAIETAIQIMDDWDESDRAKVNIIAGQAGVAADGGATSATTQRVVQANGAGKTISSTGGSASTSGNNTLVSAGTNRLKVFAFSLTTTSTTAMTCIFQSGASGTELWRAIIQAPTGANAGANLSVAPPAWLFATASATLLNLNLSSANAVHWSVSYFDEA